MMHDFKIKMMKELSLSLCPKSDQGEIFDIHFVMQRIKGDVNQEWPAYAYLMFEYSKDAQEVLKVKKSLKWLDANLVFKKAMEPSELYLEREITTPYWEKIVACCLLTLTLLAIGIGLIQFFKQISADMA